LKISVLFLPCRGPPVPSDRVCTKVSFSAILLDVSDTLLDFARGHSQVSEFGISI
jgi:hypothetical protein